MTPADFASALTRDLSERWSITPVQADGEEFSFDWHCDCGMDHPEHFTLPQVYSDAKRMDAVTLQFCVMMVEGEFYKHIAARPCP